MPDQSLPRLNELWKYESSHNRGFTAKCISWNRKIVDIIAVGYGFNSEEDKGLVCVWNIKNLEYPERVYQLPFSVTSCDFSGQSPNLLAVGLANGIVHVFNVASKKKESALDTVGMIGRHIGKYLCLVLLKQNNPLNELLKINNLAFFSIKILIFTKKG